VCTPLTEPCVTGYYYERIVCTRCPLHHATPPNPQNILLYIDSCVCLAGYEKTQQYQCVPCSHGYYAPDIDTYCRKSPAGTHVSVIGSTFAQACPDNWISTFPGASFCVPCPWGTSAAADHTVCLPKSTGTPPVAQTREYQLGFFCAKSSDLSRGYLPSTGVISKLSSNIWDGDVRIVTLYPNFLRQKEHFQYGATCQVGFLVSTPVNCSPGSYAMRLHAYIWECVPCRFGTYKTTQGTSKAECLDCTGPHCPQIEQACAVSGNVYAPNSQRNAPQHFQTIVEHE